MTESLPRQQYRRLAGILLLAVFCAACASAPQTRQLTRSPPALDPRIELIQVPFYPQQEYHCGPAALASVLGYRGIGVLPDDIARQIYVPDLKGALQAEVVAATRQYDLLPVKLDGRLESLLRELADGNPVFILQNLGLASVPVWHYEVLIGYDLPRQEMILRSGVNRRILRRFKTFEQTWARAGHWALVVTPVDSIPVSASADAFVDAVIGLEQVGKVPLARRGYARALQRWPQHLLAQTGLGNTAYAMGEFVAAESAYRAALALDPERAQVWNNLAYALAQLGRHEASMMAISRALELDPENRNFKDSLTELRDWQ